jgi:SAM-dependent MidA family methyltransferase
LLTANEQTPLAERLRRRIAREGALTFRDWMAAALYDERDGYYRRADLTRWGRTGDYRTSPERTPLFAATFARYFASLHEQLGSPARWTIYEAGAGACDFARVVLETLSVNFPQVFSSTRYAIEEINHHSREAALAKLAPYLDRVEFRRFDDSTAERANESDGENACALDEVSNEARDEAGDEMSVGVVFSNELIDALPVHRVAMRSGRLQELCVGLDAANNFTWIEREPTVPQLAAHFARFGIALAEGQRAEVNLACEAWLARAASMFARSFVVTVDYGSHAAGLYDRRLRAGGTLRAFRAHALSEDLLADPGSQDLTTTINWTQLELAGRGAGLETVLFERQDKFLLRAGAVEQLELMCAHAQTEGERTWLRVGAREMILPGRMSESFQVLVQKK